MHNGFTRRGPDWRLRIIALMIALAGAASTSPVWHEEHGADQDCVVCHVRHHAVADLTDALRIRPVGAAERIGPTARLTWMTVDHGYQVPPRAPPA